MPRFFHLALALFLFIAPWASAVIIVDDPFTDGSVTNTTGGDLAGTIYYKTTAAAGVTLAVQDDAAGIGTGNALLFTPNGNFQGFLTNFPAVQLANAGETFRISFDIRFTQPPANDGSGFRCGVYDSSGTLVTTHGGSTVDDKGYGFFCNPGIASNFTVQKEASGDSILGGTTFYSALSSANPGSLPAFGLAKHSISLQVTRLANGDLSFVGQIDNGTPSNGTLLAAAVLTYRLDQLAIGFPGNSTSRPIFIDNVKVTYSQPGSVAIASPFADTILPGSLTITANAADPDGVARVDFYDGNTKLGESNTAPYSFTLPSAAPGIYALRAVMIDGDGVAMSSSRVAVRVTGAGTDEFDTLRQKWRVILTGGDGFTVDSDVQSRINSITNAANSNWNTLDKSPARTFLWSDLTSTTVSAQLTSAFGRLRSMALALRTQGSPLQDDATLRADVISALEWMYANRYNENKALYDNWWEWEIGSQQHVTDILILLHDHLTPTQIANQTATLEKFTPTGVISPVIGNTTGANRVWEVGVVALRGIILKKPGVVAGARDAYSPVFPDVTSGDGFYSDGSFIQHTRHPYTGGYGTSLIATLGVQMHLLAGSSWQITDPQTANLYRWIRESFEPLLFRGEFMDMARGREMSRSGTQSHVSGHGLISSVLRVAQFAPAADAVEFKRMAKTWIQSDTFRTFTSNAGLPTLLLGKAVLADPSVIPKPELTGHWNFARMDRVVHRRPTWAFGLSMRSSRIYNYESINGENLKGWHNGDGATFLYTASDLGQFSEFWPTVNHYRIPGTTVDTVARADGEGQSSLNGNNWVGGANLGGVHGAVGMDFAGHAVTLTAKKSWFLFDDEIVALGAGINSTNGRPIETIVENRKLGTTGNEAFTVNGTAQSTALGWSSTLTATNWAHLAGTGGYYFPGSATVKGLREARIGNWRLVNTGGSTTSIVRNYLTLFFDHGSNPVNANYAYAILPNKSASETAAYANAPAFQVLENSALAQGARHTGLNIDAVNFWTDGTRTVGSITSSHKASVLSRATPGRLEIAVSDPTQANAGSIIVEVSRATTGVIVSDPAIVVQQHAPSTRLSVNVAAAAGRTLSIALSTALPTVSITASTPNASEQGSTPGAFTITREGPLDFPLTLALQRAGTATSIADFTGAGTTVNFATDEAVKNVSVHPIADGLAEGPETVVLTIPAGVGYTVGASSSALVTLLDAPFDQWRMDNNLPNIIGTDDSDGDGMVDQLEYTLAGNPRVANPAEWPKATIVGQHLTLVFRRNTLAVDSTIKVQAAENVAGPWQDLAQSINGGDFTSLVGPSVVIVEQAAGTARNVTVTDSATVGGSGQPTRFLRVQAVR